MKDSLRRGAVRESDGRMFWGRETRKSSTGERLQVDIWLTPESFKLKRETKLRGTKKWLAKPENRDKVNTRQRYRFKTDPDYREKACAAARKRSRKAWISNPKAIMLSVAKRRARLKEVPFGITIDDFNIPEVCPILGLKLRRAKGIPDSCSPELDRVIPKLGYVPGNVWVISGRANRIKKDATLEELKKLVTALEAKLLT